MLRCLTLALLMLFGLRAQADNIVTVKIADTGIQLTCPPGMVDMPKDDPMVKAMADLVPSDCQLLRACISSEAFDAKKASDPSEDIMGLQTLAMKDALMDIYSGDFIDFVDRVSIKATRGDLSSEYSGFDYVEAQKRVDQFQKDTGIGVQEDGDLYSLGIVSRSDACVAYMEAQYLNLTFQGKTQREKCVSVVAYVRLKQKVLVVVTWLTKATILQDDIRTLQHTAEKYQIDLQLLNNS